MMNFLCLTETPLLCLFLKMLVRNAIIFRILVVLHNANISGSDTPLPGLTLEVVDKDVSKNAEFSLSLEAVSPNSEGVFYVYPERALGKTPVIIRVKDPERLDYENEAARNFQFNVIAETSNGEQIKSEISVVVTDSNDNIPQFAEKSYEYTVAEDAEGEYPIAKIEAFENFFVMVMVDAVKSLF